MNNCYIGFEGPIGAGKTTLSQLLAAHTAATIVLEDVDNNEFLADFYSDRERWALPMQLWFLTARHRQLMAVLSQDAGLIVGDYTFAKDEIFARTLLTGRDLRLYERIAAGLRVLRRPDLVVYLDADDDVLLERIARRNRSYETAITKEYLDTVRTAYEARWNTAAETNLFRVNTTALNLQSRSELTNLYDSIRGRCP